MTLRNLIPRFSLRQLFWFTALAALGCWWWLPSSESIAQPDPFSFPWRQGEAIELVSEVRQYSNADAMNNDNVRFSWPPNVDSRHYDVAILPMLRICPLDVFASCNSHSRLGGLIVIAFHHQPGELPQGFGESLLVVPKQARVLYVTETQANLIDGAVAAVLIALAIGGISLDRPKRPKVAGMLRMP